MLPAIIAQLEQLIAQIQSSGAVAHEDARLDISTHAKSGYEYARLRNGSQRKSCGRVGSELYIEVLATLHRRDQIAQLTQAIDALSRAEEIPRVSEPGKSWVTAIASESAASATAPPKVQSVPVARSKKPKVRNQLYTHVKTKQGSVIHAVLGKDNRGEWRTAALCGATPPQRDHLGWEFPTHDDGVTCPKCYRKLPSNGKRHLPSLG